MKIEQFKDAPLAHYSYAVISEGKMALVDPSRNPLQYYRHAEANNAEIVAVFETHPHADFVSGHKQIQEQTGAKVYTSKLTGATYEHLTFDQGDELQMGKVSFRAINTPGHSPDSITIVAEAEGKIVLFTGDTLFVGDVGRPDLREKVGNMTAQRISLAKDMYRTIRNGFSGLPDQAVVYPAHGAGSLCGKNMSSESATTLGNERKYNWAFRNMPEPEFVETILKDQPFIPHYFGFDVELNRVGGENVQRTKASVPLLINPASLTPGIPVVDSRDEKTFKKGHFPGSINIMARHERDKFETWLGAIVEPEESFYLVVAGVDQVRELLERTAKIGYEKQIEAILIPGTGAREVTPVLDLKKFAANQEHFTIVDIRNEPEVNQKMIFRNSLHIPLFALRDRLEEIPTDKPIVVHCAGGYRSAAGSSIIQDKYAEIDVFDLSEDIRKF